MSEKSSGWSQSRNTVTNVRVLQKKKKKSSYQPGVVIDLCESEASPVYTVTHCLKKLKEERGQGIEMEERRNTVTYGQRIIEFLYCKISANLLVLAGKGNYRNEGWVLTGVQQMPLAPTSVMSPLTCPPEIYLKSSRGTGFFTLYSHTYCVLWTCLTFR